MSESTPGRGLSPYLWGTCLILLALFAALFYLADGLADPFLGSADIEGQLLLNAVEQQSGRDVPTGHWQPVLLAPIHTGLHATSFRLFGVDLLTARRLSAVLGALVLLLFYRVLRPSFGEGTSFLAVAIMAINPVFIAVVRTSLPATTSLLLMLLAMRLWVAGRSHRLWAAFGGAAVVWAGLVENGPHALFFVAAGLGMLFLLRLHAWKMAWRDHTDNRLRAAWAGGGLVLLVFLGWVLSHWAGYGATWGHFGKLSIHMATANLILAPQHLIGMVRFMPFTLVLALGYFLFFAKDAIRPVARHRRLDEVRLWLLCWFLSGLLFSLVLVAPPFHALVLLLPPLCALASEALTRMLSIRRVERASIDIMIVMAWIAITLWFVVAYAVFSGFLRLEAGYWSRHQLRGAMLVSLILWPLLTWLVGWAYLRLRRSYRLLPPRFIQATAAVLLVGLLALSGSDALTFWRGRGHEVDRLQTELAGEWKRGDLVVGSWAPVLTLGTEAAGTFMWPGVNDEPAAWLDRATHLLLQGGRESDPSQAPSRYFPPDTWAGDPRPLRLGERELWLYPLLPGR